MADGPLLRVEQLSTHFDTRAGLVRAVDGVSFQVEAGETLGLVGESGCGKSVLSRTIMGLLPSYARVPDQSRILFDGIDLLTLGRRQRRAISGPGLAMVFQDPMTSLNPVLRIGEQIAESMRFHFGISRSDGRRKAISLLGDVGIPQPVVRVDNLGSSSVDIIARPWVNTPDYWETRWALTQNVKAALDAAGISIPYPHQVNVNRD